MTAWGLSRGQIKAATKQRVLKPTLRQTEHRWPLQHVIFLQWQPPRKERSSWEVTERWWWLREESTIFPQHPADHPFGNKFSRRLLDWKDLKIILGGQKLCLRPPSNKIPCLGDSRKLGIWRGRGSLGTHCSFNEKLALTTSSFLGRLSFKFWVKLMIKWFQRSALCDDGSPNSQSRSTKDP